jgi:hypothetical protein
MFVRTICGGKGGGIPALLCKQGNLRSIRSPASNLSRKSAGNPKTKGGERVQVQVQTLPVSTLVFRLPLTLRSLWGSPSWGLFSRCGRFVRGSASGASCSVLIVGCLLWLATQQAFSQNANFTVINAGTAPGTTAWMQWYNTGAGAWNDVAPAYPWPIAPGASGQATNVVAEAAGYTGRWRARLSTTNGLTTVVSAEQTITGASTFLGNFTFVCYLVSTNNCIQVPATIHNSTGNVVFGYWMHNGVLEMSQSILPYSDAFYTYPCVNPATDNLKWGWNASAPLFGTDGAGNPLNQPGGTPIGGSTVPPGTGFSPTNNEPYNPTPQPMQPVLTNGVLSWAGLTNNAAMTDAAGFSLLHGDLVQANMGLNQLAATLGNLQNVDSNGFWWDGMWIQTNTARITSAITNQPSSGGGGSNVVNVNVTNDLSLTNVVQITNNFPTNIATESTLAGISNMLATALSSNGLDTNGIYGMLGSISNQANAAVGTESNLLSSLGAVLPQSAASIEGGGGDIVLANFAGGGQFKLSLSDAQSHSLFNFTALKRLIGLFIWLATLTYLVREFYDILLRMLGVTQVEGSKQAGEFLGIGGNLDIVTAALYATIIFGIILGFSAASVYFLIHGMRVGELASIIGTTSSMVGSFGQAWGYVTACFPVDDVIGAGIFYIVGEFVIMKPFCIGSCLFIKALPS